jgi:hypothetical protein
MKQRRVIQREHKYTQFELNAFERIIQNYLINVYTFIHKLYFILSMNMFLYILYILTLDKVEPDYLSLLARKC